MLIYFLNRKILFAFFVPLIVALQTNAQKKDSMKLTLGISVGAGLPLGNFKQADSSGITHSNKYQGYAKAGWDFNIKARYQITEHLGILAHLGGNVNEFKSYSLPGESVGVNNIEYNVTGSNYYIGSYLIGPIFNFQISNKFELEIHGLCGLMTVNYSTITYSAGNAYSAKLLSSPISTFKPDLSSTFGYNFGGSITWKFTKRIGIILGVDYLGGTPTFSGYTYYYYDYSSSSGHSSPVNGHFSYSKELMTTGLVNINLGTIFSFR